MIRVERAPGRLAIRSRTASRWAMAASLALHLPAWVPFALALSRAPGPVALACDRTAARCVWLASGTPREEVPLRDLARAAVRQSGRDSVLELVTRSGRRIRVADGFEAGRLAGDAEALNRFLAGDGPPTLRLEYRPGWERLAEPALLPPLVALVGIAVGRQTICRADRIARRVTVRRWRSRALPFGVVESVEVIEGAPGIPGEWPRSARGSRILLNLRGRTPLPATAWLRGGEDLGPAAQALREALGLG